VTDDHEPVTRGDLRGVEKRLDEKIDRLGALYENLDSRVRVLAEGHEALNAKVDALSATVHGMERRIIAELSTVIREGSSDLARRVTVLEHDVRELKSRPTPPPPPPASTRKRPQAAKRAGTSSGRKRSTR
jgi:hypothetical protein